MQQRQLGKDELKVSALGPGCRGMSEFYGPSEQDAAESIRVRLTPVDLAQLDAILAPEAAAGPRYHPGARQAIDRST
jgi:hypothetical protein